MSRGNSTAVEESPAFALQEPGAEQQEGPGRPRHSRPAPGQVQGE